MPTDVDFDLTSSIIAWESGECSLEREIELFQHLWDTGKLFSLQGVYQRRAQDLIEAGDISVGCEDDD